MSSLSQSTGPRRMATSVTLMLCLAAAVAGAIEVWTPETGQVDLNAPQDSAEARFREAVEMIASGDPDSGLARLEELLAEYPNAEWAESAGYLTRLEPFTAVLQARSLQEQMRLRHAAALLAADQSMSGVAQLRKLLAEHPGAEWAERAHYLIGVGLFGAGRYAKAFEQWEAFLSQYPESRMRHTVCEMQLRAAGRRAGEDLEKGLALYDCLIAGASSEEFTVRCQKEKADASLRAGEYLRASDEYLTLIDRHPDSPWAPYAWYKIAQCHLRTAEWVGRGGEYLEQARRTFRDFAANYPEHQLAGKAREELAEVRAMQAARFKNIAEYYLGPGRRPSSALPYLRYIQSELADTPLAEWAGEKMKETLSGERVPVRGHYPELGLPGVSVREQEEPEAE